MVRLSLLQCVAVFGSVLQSCFVCECTLMADVSGRVVRMSVLQCVAVCCRVLQSCFVCECASIAVVIVAEWYV